MEIYIVGSGTGVPSLRRGSPGTVIRAGKSVMLLDSGSGTLRRLLEVDIDFREIDYLLYSHFHPDHTADLVPFLFASNYGSEKKRTRELSLIGHEGIAHFYEGLKDVYGQWVIPQSYTLNIMEMQDKEIVFSDFSLQGFHLEHSDHSIGFRVTTPGGKAVAYSGDTDYCPNLILLAREADLLILECSFPDGSKVEGHLTPSLAGRVAREAGCKRLLLTHFYPPCDDYDLMGAVASQYSGEVIVAEDLMKLVI
jgi:ribonuclease BN (tRNA processing enzyme)